MPGKKQVALVGLSLCGFLALFLPAGFLAFCRYALPATGIDMHQKIGLAGVFVVVASFAAAGTILLYGTVIIWLAFAKIFFTREQVLAIANFGPLSSFDRRLIDKFFPK